MTSHKIFRLVALLWLAGWFLKIAFYAPYLLETTRQYLIIHPMFLPFFQSPDAANLFYFLPALIIPLVFLRRPLYRKLSAGLMVLCAGVLNLHINTCNDATFVTSFWTGLWLFWFAFRGDELSGEILKHAKLLALSVVGLIFFGGFVGKLTPEYWSGQVMSQILVVGGDKPLLGAVMLSMPEGTRDVFMMWLSRLTIVTEGVLALSPWLPARLVVLLISGVCVGFCLFSTWMILSVLSCLVGLVLAAALIEKICPAKNYQVQ